ncbi:hypothetical protein [Roseovarius sp. A-2]|uniref:hypothetical protein n=1 Tax=Roseovarius sp. A-2 TaxID=1570360 RepID=UPI001594E2B0|nr:hypothetical protein [Roseovarius sp. A-2]
MTQVIDFIGGEYRNRTGVHGFAKLSMYLNLMGFMFRNGAFFGGTYDECLDAAGAV